MPTRRSFLRTGSVAGVATLSGLAGCVGRLADSPLGRFALDGTTTGPGAADRAPADAEAFTTFRGDLRRQGYQPETTVPSTVEVAWELDAVNTGEHTAAKASAVRDPAGNYVIPGDDGAVRSVALDGSVDWLAETSPSRRGIHGTPTIANGLVYVGAYDGALYAFDVESGEQLWRTQLGDAIGSSPGYHDGLVYIAVEHSAPDGSLAACDALTGEVVWTDGRPTDHPHSTIAIDRELGKLTVGSNDGTLYGWSYPDREPLWTFDTGRPIKGPIATYDGAAFFGSWDESVYRVDLETGKEDWAVATDDLVMGGASVDTDSETVYIGGHDGFLRAFDAASGEEEWHFRTGGYIVGCPTVTRDHVLVGSYDTNLYALDKADGAAVWSVDVAGWVSCDPLVDDGVVFTSRATDETPGKAVRLVGTGE
ncbi:Outer membrane protein assembly factor BamB, contains PQQ-like beta-propeller repeat [Halogranum gelatinilyticum]|uniref:Outer membrane protein assembly factor BamB, contains PQQ-like beta-propeller repeat n=1 Tax=Halogranum gelatinilyticum TaxID=660521 RepID=A0A1G9T0P4_9EURY|nr:PQQ-binding-like beta-propeller repeat protein [Halogranum gelatinilyticum]SDM41188.1 Outer membrane protein assembly factor BamB, contains PQQ-like beta-propeller repeat [Halogranum gelatinilyticum]